jgi:hypothetical protein
MKQRVIPVGFGWYAGGLYISGTVRRFQAAIGTRVLQINGLETEAALEKLGRFVARENEYSLRKEAPQWLRFPAVFQKAGLGASDTLRLLLEDAQGRKAVLPVYPIDTKNGDPTELQPVQLKRTSADLRWQPARNIYWVHWLPEEKIAYLLYNNCLSREMALEEGDTVMAQQLPTFNYFADSLITLLQQNPGARVLIDLRFNPGGGASDGIRLARRLAEMPEVNRPDRLFVAVNMYTALAAVEVAEYFNDHTAAVLLGDPPAQRPGHTGKVLPLPLPATGLEVRYSDEFPQPDKKEPGVLHPDVLIEMTFPAFRQGRDPVMDYVRKGF